MDNMQFNEIDIEALLRQIDQLKPVERHDDILLKKIVALLTNPSTKRALRLTATQALVRFPDQLSISLLMIPLTDEDKAVRVAALELCASLSHRIPVTLVAALLTDPEWSVRAAAAWALGRFGEKAPLTALIALLEEKEEIPLVRASALHALGELGERVPIEVMVNALTDEEWPVREAATITLGTLGGRAPVEPVVKRLREDEDSSVRTAAALALASIGLGLLPEDALNALHIALSDPELSVQQAADWALDEIIKHLIKAMQHPEPTTRKMAVQRLRLLGDRAPEDVLYTLLSNDPDPSVYQAAADTLGALATQTSPTSPPISEISEVTALPSHFLSKQREIRKVGNIEFFPLEPADLVQTPPIIAQAFDNQWVPRGLLRGIMNGRLTYADLAPHIAKLVRVEYIRSLINARNVVMNRAYFYNNPVVFNDFLPGQHNRETFKALLNSGVILPFLLKEETPDEPPQYTASKEGLAAWQRICQETRMSCVRFTWTDPQQQQKAFEQLARQFRAFALRARDGDFEQYLKDFDLPREAESGLKKRFAQMGRLCFDYMEEDKPITREVLYETFVTANHTRPSDRLYDGSKPFAGEIKQFLDLAYNANLADELNGYLLTPNDTLPRLALQEWKHATEQISSDKFSIDMIISLIRRDLFSHIQSGLYLKSMHLLSLHDVLKIRETEQWHAYASSLDKLLKGNISDFGHFAPDIYRHYAALMVEITTMIEGRHKGAGQTEFKAPWSPNIELVLDVSDSRLSIRWTEEGPSFAFSGQEIPTTALNGSAACVARLNIGEWSRSRTRADLFTSFDFMKGRLDAAKDLWELLRRDLGKLLHDREHREEPVKIGPTLNEKAST